MRKLLPTSAPMPPESAPGDVTRTQEAADLAADIRPPRQTNRATRVAVISAFGELRRQATRITAVATFGELRSLASRTVRVAAAATLVAGLALAAPFALAVIGAFALAPAALAAKTDPPPPQGWLGIQLGEWIPEASRDDTPAPAGVLIIGIVADSPAQKAGLRARDRILTVDGKTLSTPQDFMSTIRGYAPDSWIDLTVDRRGHERELRVGLATRPSDLSSARLLEGTIGVQAIELPPDLREHFGAPRDAGVMISKIAEGSPAEAAGLLLGDVVFEIEGEPVRSARALAAAVSMGGIGNKLEIHLARDGAEMTIEPTVEQKREDAGRP